MPYRELRGNLFDSSAQALVNTVNCEGAMGKGIALEFRRRFPAMFKDYRQLCEKRLLKPGQIWPYTKTQPYVLNFAIKSHWRFPARMEWVEEPLRKFAANYQRMGIQSVAFPWMGASNGGLPLADVRAVTRKYLQPLEDIDIEIYTFDPLAPDPLFRAFRQYTQDHTVNDLREQSGLIKKHAQALLDAIENRSTVSMATLIENAGLGGTSTDKLYAFLVAPKPDAPTTLQLGFGI